MSSITYWNRLEPRPRARNLNETLAARLRDPLWLLCRQWQFGEFAGEDAGSPAFATINAASEPVTAWRGATEEWRPAANDRPIESIALAEPFAADDLSLQVELALIFERELRSRPGLTSQRVELILQTLRDHLPLSVPSATDVEAQRIRLVCHLRALDGVALFALSRNEPPSLPAGAVIDAGDLPAVQDAQRAFAKEAAMTFGEFGTGDPPSWRPERLEFEGTLTLNAETRTDFRLMPSFDASLDWYALDGVAASGEPPRGKAEPLRQSTIPVHVGFRGMPNARWWDFESGQTDYGDLLVDKRDVAKLVIMDFMLIHGNDWFLVPLEQKVGTGLKIFRLTVTDVFGDTVIVPRSDQLPDAAPDPWRLFASSVIGNPEVVIPELVLLPSAGGALQIGEPLEEVRFFRDETVNVVWAVEKTIASLSGEPRPGHESSAATAREQQTETGGLRYVIQTEVPRHWIPFVPVTLDPVSGEITLERAAMLDATAEPPVPIEPAGRILRPAPTPYRVREEEISRAGVRIVRVACRARWTDGTTHVWITRMRRAAGGEGSSGLLFDAVAER
jgi:hypothetical protein